MRRREKRLSDEGPTGDGGALVAFRGPGPGGPTARECIVMPDRLLGEWAGGRIKGRGYLFRPSVL